MNIVFITEPAWFERAIPGWVQPNSHIVVTDSDTVVNEAMNKGIEIWPLGQFFTLESPYELMVKSIMQESNVRNRLSELLYSERFLSEILHGISNIIFQYRRMFIIIRELFSRYNNSDITFVYGDRFY